MTISKLYGTPTLGTGVAYDYLGTRTYRSLGNLFLTLGTRSEFDPLFIRTTIVLKFCINIETNILH